MTGNLTGFSRAGFAVALLALTGCEDSGRPFVESEPAPLATAEEALANVDLAPFDPSPMSRREVAGVLSAPARCEFRYTRSGDPIFAIAVGSGGATGRAIMKLNGYLVPFETVGEVPGIADGGFEIAAGDARAALSPVVGDTDPSEHREAEMTFAVGESLSAGYGGFYRCET